VQLLTCETPDFIAPTLWPANNPDNQSGRLPDLGESAGACVPQPDSRRRASEVAFDLRVGTCQQDCHR